MQPNEKLLRDGYAAMARGDGKLLAEMLAPDALWTIPGHSPLAGTYIGLKQIFTFWKRVAELAPGGLRLEVQDVLANDERGVCSSWVAERASAVQSKSVVFTSSGSNTVALRRHASTTKTKAPMTPYGQTSKRVRRLCVNTATPRILTPPGRQQQTMPVLIRPVGMTPVTPWAGSSVEPAG